MHPDGERFVPPPEVSPMMSDAFWDEDYGRQREAAITEIAGRMSGAVEGLTVATARAFLSEACNLGSRLTIEAVGKERSTREVDHG
jgi:hypothetical protein